MVIEVLFLLILSIIIHSYITYPLIIKLLSKKSKTSVDYPELPAISILIAAYNEEKVIEERINNILKSDYDMDKIEILVGSDCSSDDTNKILTKLAEKNKNLTAFLFYDRSGKAGVINKLYKNAQNPILVFTDANTEFKADSLKKIVTDFSDEKVGCVSGRLVLSANKSFQEKSVEEKSYWNYESFIKKSEGSRGILIGANGGFFAIREKLFREIPIEKAVTDDFFVSLNALSEGYKVTYKYDALAFEDMGKTVKDEYKRKVRFSATNFQTISFFPNLLFNKNLLISFALWSHKIFRWMIPLLLPIAFVLNLLLVTKNLVYLVILEIQIVIYILAILGWLFSKINFNFKLFSLPYFFIMANIAVFHGFFRFLSKKHSVIWQSTER